MRFGQTTFPAFLAAILASASAGALAADPQKTFEEVFGKEARQAAATPDKRDDAEFAAKLLTAGDAVQGDPAFRAVLYEKSYESGIRGPLGYATAVKAIQRLAELDSDRKDEADAKLLAVYQLQYKVVRSDDDKAHTGLTLVDQLVTVAEARIRGGEFTEASALCRQGQTMLAAIKSDRKDQPLARLKRIMARLAACQQAEQLKARLEADPKDKTAATQLFQVYLVDLDNPAEAAKYADLGTDDITKKYVLVAAMKPENIPEAACQELGDWYKDLAGAAAGGSKAAMLAKARLYYEQFLVVHPAEDVPRMKAALALEQVNKVLAAIGGAPNTWVDLLKMIEPTKDCIDGRWFHVDAALSSDNFGNARIRIRYEPPEEYDFQITFTRQEDAGHVGIILNHQGTLFGFFLGGSQFPRSGFATVAGADTRAANNPTALDLALKSAEKHTCLVQVRKETLKAYVDGKLISQYKTDYKDMGMHPAMAAPNLRPLGLATGSVTIFHSVKLLEVAGKGKAVR
jgi:hypothetical protein